MTEATSETAAQPALMPLRETIPHIAAAIGRPVSYSKAWYCALEGLVPSQRQGSRIFILESDLPLMIKVVKGMADQRAATTAARAAERNNRQKRRQQQRAGTNTSNSRETALA